MVQVNVEKSIILTNSVGKRFDSIYDRYSKYGDRFEVWCGLDYTGYDKKGWTEKAIKELKRCGELGMPVRVHVADPYWRYLPMDEQNNGFMNANIWKVDTTKENLLMHAELLTNLDTPSDRSSSRQDTSTRGREA